VIPRSTASTWGPLAKSQVEAQLRDIRAGSSSPASESKIVTAAPARSRRPASPGARANFRAAHAARSTTRRTALSSTSTRFGPCGHAALALFGLWRTTKSSPRLQAGKAASSVLTYTDDRAFTYREMPASRPATAA
jgi:hypothetical protein